MRMRLSKNLFILESYAVSLDPEALKIFLVLVSSEVPTLPATSDARPEVNDHLQRVVFDTPSNFPC